MSQSTPLAARIIAARQLDPACIRGSGTGGRIRLSDVAPARQTTESPLVALAAPAIEVIVHAPDHGAPSAPHQAERLSAMRKTIARRLSESKQTIPHFYLTSHLRADPLLALREELNAKLQPRGIKLSLNDMIVKALAAALTQTPRANVQFGNDTLYRFERVDVSVAVAVPNGLVTPVIRSVNSKPMSVISQEMRELASRAREGRLDPADYEGGTVSISNLGMYGVDEIVPVINPPQALILGVGSVRQQAAVIDGQMQPASVLTATASFDHRAIDGATAAEFMSALRQLIEDPFAMLAA